MDRDVESTRLVPGEKFRIAIGNSLVEVWHREETIAPRGDTVELELSVRRVK